MPEFYAHPETGEQIPIPEGAVIVRNGDTINTITGPQTINVEHLPDGELLFWQEPGETPEGELHPNQVPDYEPRFDRQGSHRRVLAFITTEDFLGRGPRNTAARVEQDMLDSHHQPVHVDRVDGLLADLTAAGLIDTDENGVVTITPAGRTELSN